MNMARCIRIPKREGEDIRSRLLDANMLDTRHKIFADGDHLMIPVLCDTFEGHEAEEFSSEEAEVRYKDYKEVLDFPDWLSEELPTSFDIIGDVALIKLSEVLLPYKKEIGDALMLVTAGIRVVMIDSGVKGEFRIRDLEKIAGTGSSETIHKEFGTKINTDPSKVYFNPRLAGERARIALEVKKKETVIDMFSGVAPFPLVISKLANPEVIYSIDLNPEAEKFMKANIEMNHADKIVPIIGDAREVLKDLPMADRIIMNLPQSSEEFLDSALGSAKTGATIHMYRVLERSEMEDFISELKEKMSVLGYRMHIARISELKTYSPTMSVYAFDIVKD